MRFWYLILIVIFLALAGIFLAVNGPYFKVSPTTLENIERIRLLIEESKKKISTPGPLRLLQPSVQEAEFLRKDAIIEHTNTERTARGLTLLAENTQLNLAAVSKVEDMISKNYFAHVSPEGKDVSFWVDGVGYGFITVGENLAVGNFESEEALVRAWMESPGHRENILNERFREIGVAAGRGDYEGREAWYAVQIFAMPESACPAPSKALIAEIEALEEKEEARRAALDKEREALEETSPRDREYRTKVEAFNQEVASYNELIDELKEKIAVYNLQVTQFNQCAQG